jgi:hypothetical protein
MFKQMLSTLGLCELVGACTPYASANGNPPANAAKLW